MEDLVIRNGLVVTPGGTVRGGLVVRGEKILQIGPDESLPQAKLEVDAKGNYLLPGLVDPHVHFGRAEEEDFADYLRKESVSAAISGVTTFMGFVRFGEILEPRLPIYRKGKEIAKQNSFIDFKFHAYLFTEEQFEEIPKLFGEGITSVKLMLNYTPESAKKVGYRAVDFGFVYRIMELLASYGPPALIQAHCEHPDIINLLSERLEAQGRNDFLAWAESRPALCETIHSFTMGSISLETGCPFYNVHVTNKETVDIIRYLRQRGAKIYAETCPHYLTLTKDTPTGVLARMSPPLRTEDDIEHLWQAVADGTFDTIGSDHVPLYRKQKEEDGVWKGIAGVGGIGAMLPIMMTEGVNKGRITIERLVKLNSENPARIWGIYPQKGALSPGSDADIVIVDPYKEWVLSAANLKSRADYSIHEGRAVKGKAIKTFVRGKLVAEDAVLVAETALGKYVEPCLAGAESVT
ncbi:dihydroorotase family protein [Chloroflexota bacterium]